MPGLRVKRLGWLPLALSAALSCSPSSSGHLDPNFSLVYVQHSSTPPLGRLSVDDYGNYWFTKTGKTGVDGGLDWEVLQRLESDIEEGHLKKVMMHAYPRAMPDPCSHEPDAYLISGPELGSGCIATDQVVDPDAKQALDHLLALFVEKHAELEQSSSEAP